MTTKAQSTHFSSLNRFIIKKGSLSTHLFLLLILSTYIVFFGLGPLCSDLSQSSSPHLPVNEPLLTSTFGSDLQDAGTSMHPLTCPGTVQNVILPFSGFIQNLGQVFDATIEYYYSSSGLSVGFSASRITFVSEATEDQQPTQFTLTFPGSDPVSPVGRNKNSHYTNYFYGELQLTNVPSWDELWYYGLFPGIDLHYYLSDQGLKYDFIVRPGADPSQIVIQVSESMNLSIENQAVLLHPRTDPDTYFKDTKLQAWQVDGTIIPVRFTQHDAYSNAYGFELGSFDSTQILIIDPIWLTFSTFLGGSSFDLGHGITVDAMGNTYVVGVTRSSDFPILDACQSIYGGGYEDAFVTKINATGTGLVFSTFLGGSSRERGHDIVVDAEGNCYVIGYTRSGDFPTKNAFQSTPSGEGDVFVTKLNATGNGLIFSTYFGGSESEGYSGYGYTKFPNAIMVDAEGNSFITGYTESSDFPTLNAYQTSHGGGKDVFVAKLNATGNGLVFSTYFGGSNDDYGYDLTIDATGNIYITGETGSSDFPVTSNAYQSIYGGYGDAFITKLDATGTGLMFSTYLGGNASDGAYGTVVNAAGYCYITGYTYSSDFPVTPHTYQSTRNGSKDIFVTKLNATGTGLAFSTYLGGRGFDEGFGIAVDGVGNCVVVGATSSSNFPTKNAYQDHFGGLDDDVFVTKLNATGNGLVFSTYLGGDGIQVGLGIAVDAAGNSYITGFTFSRAFPTKNAYQDHFGGGGGDLFVTKFSDFGFLYPSGGETLSGIVLVQWRSIVDPSSQSFIYNLYYSMDNGTNWVIMASDLTNTSYRWDTTTVTDANTYLLQVVAEDSTGNTLEDTTASPFTIQNRPSIIYPNGGEILNDTITVQWTAVPDPSGIFYSVFYSPDAGTTWYELAVDLSATHYTWDTTTVPNGSKYLMKIIATFSTGFTTENTSNAPFTIDNLHFFTPPTIIYPNGGEILKGTALIQWTSANDSLGYEVSYAVSYSADNGLTWNVLTLTHPQTYYPWDTTTVAGGTTFLVKVVAFSAGGLNATDTSDSTFTIQNSSTMVITTTTVITPGWTIGIFLALILTVILYRKRKKRQS
ncbi:MAG: SBBP repeat-containing protein [Candidatus Hodarchaeota archaeon]